MADIKIRKVVKGTIKTLDKTIKESERIKNNFVKLKDSYKYNDEDSVDNNISNNIYGNINTKIDKINNYGKKSFQETKANIYKTKDRVNKYKIKKAERKLKASRINTPSKSIKNKLMPLKKVKYTTRENIGSVKKTSRATYQTSKRGVQMVRQSMNKTAKSIKQTFKILVSSFKVVIASIKALIMFLIAGGWVAMIVIIIICLIGLLCSSIFGIFFASDKTVSQMSIDNDKTINSVISEINIEFISKLNEIQTNNKHDDFEINSNRSEWKEVLSIYAVKVNMSEEGTDVITLSDDKINILKSIFWEMNSIEYSTSKEQREITIINDDNTTETITQEQTILYINVNSKSVDEMADLYNFTKDQKEMLSELLSDEYKSLWSSVIYGTSIGNSNIVDVAISQIGNVGGQPYWSWYGFNNRVEWCACFVSWCANELGYIKSGIIPKFAGCYQGELWFKACGLWKEAGFVPKPGDIIFFDWENDRNVDHVGIVEDLENNTVHTIEGNSDNTCRRKQYNINSNVIYGYGIPMY